MEIADENTIKQVQKSDTEDLDAGLLLQEIGKKDKEIKTLRAKVSWFEEQFKLAQSKRFAKSSEKQSSQQTLIFDEDDEHCQDEPEQDTPTEEITYTRKKPNRKEKLLDTNGLEREQRYIDLPENEKQCACGQQLEKFGEEVKEEIELIPMTLKVIEHIRCKYTCRQCETVSMPKAIELPIPKSKASASLLTEIILNKYRFHLPFYRQSKWFASHQLSLSDSTIAGWVMKAAEHLEPLREALESSIPLVHALQADETPVKVLNPEKKAYMWLFHSYLPGQRFVLFEFNLGRSSSVPNERLKDYSGLLQTDGYSGYAGQRKRKEVVTLGCWDHARRKFTDVIKACGNNKTGKAGMMVSRIAKLYEIEEKIKHLPFDERQAIRQKEAKPKLESILGLLQKINAPPKSLLGVAVTYAKNQWPELIKYIEHGEAQISNCLTENQVRPFAVGKRNWLFLGNPQSAAKAALLYSLIQSCEMNSMEPRAYLTYVLNQVHRMRRKEVDPMTLLPHTIDKSLLDPPPPG